MQETFLRAWRRRDKLKERSALRAWLYKIATNACLDALDKGPRRPTASGEVLWLRPYPDELLEELAGDEDDPEPPPSPTRRSSSRISSPSSDWCRSSAPC